MIAKVIPEQAKEMRPKPLHVPSTPAIQTPPEVQVKVHKHRSARKLLKVNIRLDKLVTNLLLFL